MKVPDQRSIRRLGERAEHVHLDAVGVDNVGRERRDYATEILAIANRGEAAIDGVPCEVPPGAWRREASVAQLREVAREG